MAKTITKVIYKPDSQSTEEYTVLVNPEEFKKWKNGDTTIPLADVVDSFEVFHSSQGAQGLLGKPSNQQLDTTFGTHKDTEVVLYILNKGKEQSSDAISTSPANTNAARGSSGISNTQGGLRTK